MKDSKTKKCFWCNKRKNIDYTYYLGYYKNTKREIHICDDCNYEYNVV